MEKVSRRLAGILAADVVGYSAMIGVDEPATLARVGTLRTHLIEPLAATHGGRLFKTTGDGFLAAFASAVEALRCAIAIQERLRSEPDGLRLRIGVHQGEVVTEGDDLLGDGVIIAARLEPLAEPGGICISARVREDAAGKMALEVDDLGTPELKNIARKVQVFRVQLGPAERPVLPLPDKPSLVVLPFQNMSEDPEQEYFADGMVEEIITALSRIRWLFVIARSSSFTYKGRSVDVKQVGRELGVHYVLEGSVRKAVDRVRIAVQLIDALTGAHLWADRFEGSLDGVFEFQDKVAHFVAGAIEPRLEAAEIKRSARKPPSNLTAYDLYLRALPNTFSLRKASAIQAIDLLGQAIDHDPCYGPALALAAWWRMHLEVNGWADDEADNRHKAVELARRALQVADDDPAALADAAGVLAEFGEDIDFALSLVDRALRLNPSCVTAWHWSAWLRLSSGEPNLAIEHFEKSLRLDPRAQGLRPIYLTGIGIAHFMRRQFSEACPLLLESLQQLPSYVTTYRFLAACYAHMGRLGEAWEVIRRLRALTSDVLGSATHFRNPEHRELFLSGLRLAMGYTP